MKAVIHVLPSAAKRMNMYNFSDRLNSNGYAMRVDAKTGQVTGHHVTEPSEAERLADHTKARAEHMLSRGES